MTGISRRQFLRADFCGRRVLLLPPWALDEDSFLCLCSDCDACIEACREGVLVRSPSGRPAPDFRLGRCTFCGACVESCEIGALTRTTVRAPPWRYIAHSGNRCLAFRGVMCASCRDACDSGAIRMAYRAGSVAVPEIHGPSCTGCGGCVGVCPANAIEVY